MLTRGEGKLTREEGELTREENMLTRVGGRLTSNHWEGRLIRKEDLTREDPC